MSDQRLRELERRFRTTGAASDEAAWLRERLRRGQLVAGRVELAAYLGHEAAALACAAEGLRPPTLMDASLARLPSAERSYWERVAREVQADTGIALGQGFESVRRPAWCLGLARFGREACLRALVAAAALLLDAAQPVDVSEHLQVAADTVRGDPRALNRAAGLPRTHGTYLWGSVFARELREVLIGLDHDALHRLCAALNDVLRVSSREDAFRAATRAALLPWALGDSS